MIRRLLFFVFTISVVLVACTDNESFSSASGGRLTFSEDTVKFDTLFSTVPSVTETFWVHNESADGIRIQTIRLERGTQSGFRVNVDGTYLNPVGTDFEVRKGDSLLVFVEVTTRENHSLDPMLVEDNLLFTLENGAQQKVNLRTYSWDAQKVTNLVVSRDTTIESATPLIVYGDGIRVDSAATLTLLGKTLYFHDGAGIDVHGQLVADGCVFRGDRLDHMFDYLPYDRVSGQWRGIEIASSSEGNLLTNCEIRNAWNALVCDSTSLQMQETVIHNSRGMGLSARNSVVVLSYCQLTNTLGDCLSLDGCEAVIDHCTLAQFYPFSADRGAAFRFTNTTMPMVLLCTNTLATGYEDDVVMGEVKDTAQVFDYRFSNCILRTDSVSDEKHFEDMMWETPKDSIQGKKHFRNIDEDNLYYDFTIDSISPAFSRGIGRGDFTSAEASRRANKGVSRYSYTLASRRPCNTARALSARASISSSPGKQ